MPTAINGKAPSLKLKSSPAILLPKPCLPVNETVPLVQSISHPCFHQSNSFLNHLNIYVMQAPTIYVRKELSLPDLEQWQFRFNVQSETSDRLYTIAQHKTKKHWG